MDKPTNPAEQDNAQKPAPAPQKPAAQPAPQAPEAKKPPFPPQAAPAPQNPDAKSCKKGEGGDDEGDEPEEESEMEEKSKKSLDLTGEDLEKSLGKLNELVQKSDTGSRKDALLAKAQKGEDLSKSERAELFDLLGGEKPAPAPSEEITKGLKENDTLQKALDVSDYLSEQHKELCKSLGALGETVQKSDTRQHEFNLVLAKAVSDVGHLVKSMAENLNAIAQAPARAPKSSGVPGGQPLNKSFAGAPAQGEDQLSKSEIMDTLEVMLTKSATGMSESGENLLVALSKYEQTNHMTPALFNEVKAFRKSATH